MVTALNLFIALVSWVLRGFVMPNAAIISVVMPVAQFRCVFVRFFATCPHVCRRTGEYMNSPQLR